MNLLLAQGLLAAALLGNPAQAENVYSPIPEIPTEVCMVNPDGHDKDKHDKDKHDKDKHDGHGGGKQLGMVNPDGHGHDKDKHDKDKHDKDKHDGHGG